MGTWILAIDPGNEESAYVLLNPELMPVRFAKCANELMFMHAMDSVQEIYDGDPDMDLHVAIEMIASYGMPVGKEVFETCVWIGQLVERFKNFKVTPIFRKDEKLTICSSPRANDATIRQALVDRFAPGTPNKGKGSKKWPGWFYGFRADIWQAYAVGVTYHDMYMEDGNDRKAKAGRR